MQVQFVPTGVDVTVTPVGNVSVMRKGLEVYAVVILARGTLVAWLVANTCAAIARPLLRGAST